MAKLETIAVRFACISWATAICRFSSGQLRAPPPWKQVPRKSMWNGFLMKAVIYTQHSFEVPADSHRRHALAPHMSVQAASASAASSSLGGRPRALRSPGSAAASRSSFHSAAWPRRPAAWSAELP